MLDQFVALQPTLNFHHPHNSKMLLDTEPIVLAQFITFTVWHAVMSVSGAWSAEVQLWSHLPTIKEKKKTHLLCVTVGIILAQLHFTFRIPKQNKIYSYSWTKLYHWPKKMDYISGLDDVYVTILHGIQHIMATAFVIRNINLMNQSNCSSSLLMNF